METLVQVQPGTPRFAAVPEMQLACARMSARVLDHPFLRRCADGTVGFGELERFLVQQGKYSRFFTRYLCALISQLDDAASVLRLAENLAEELGLGDGGGVPHSRIYADMLERFGLRADEHPTYPETQNLIDTMFMLCRQPGGVAGLGALCLGGEALVPAVYAAVMRGFLGHGVPEDSLEFFSLHIHCDDDHAETMYGIIEALVERDPANRVRILAAGEVAIDARLRFLDALSEGLQ